MTFTKEQILHEMRRTAESNGGKPLGEIRLAKETGIRRSDWQRFWARIPDAHGELGVQRNEMTKPHSIGFLLDAYAAFAKSLGRLPTKDDLIHKAKSQSGFPHTTVFERRFKSKQALVSALHEHCTERAGLDDIREMCETYKPPARDETDASPHRGQAVQGYIYMLRDGRMYKIGKTMAFGRRQRELSIQLPRQPNTVHVIATDDPSGIEEYWHRRFADKRRRGEWFELNADEVKAFRRRKFM